MTGCMDAGLQLVKKGYRVSVAVSSKDIGFLASKSDVVVVDTESRNSTPEEAQNKVRDLVRNMDAVGYSLIYKKVDSTLRGNIGSELEALIQDHRYDLIVFAPALPYGGRTTRDGIHYVNSLELTQSDIAKDPFSPVNSSYIPHIINYQTDFKVAAISLSEVRQDACGLTASFDDFVRKGFKLAVTDAETEEDLVNISAALKNCKSKVLACGSAGLFRYMLEEKNGGLVQSDELQFNYKSPEGPVLIVSGSPAEAAKRQLENLRKKGVRVLRLDMENRRRQNSGWLHEVENIKKEAVKTLLCGDDIAIDGAGEGKAQIYEAYKSSPESLRKMSRVIQDTISEIFECVSLEARIGGAVIAGGDTVFNICERLSVRGLVISGEIEPLIPCGYAAGGRIDGMPLVTKAGGFGSPDAILKSIRYLKGDKYDGK